MCAPSVPGLLRWFWVLGLLSVKIKSYEDDEIQKGYLKDDERTDFNIGKLGAYVSYQPATGYIEESRPVRCYYHEEFFGGASVSEKKKMVERYQQNGH